MKTHSKFKAEVGGTGIYVPAETRTNADLEKTLNTSDDWIRTRTGIHERHIREKGLPIHQIAIVLNHSPNFPTKNAFLIENLCYGFFCRLYFRGVVRTYLRRERYNLSSWIIPDPESRIFMNFHVIFFEKAGN